MLLSDEMQTLFQLIGSAYIHVVLNLVYRMRCVTVSNEVFEILVFKGLDAVSDL